MLMLFPLLLSVLGSAAIVAPSGTTSQSGPAVFGIAGVLDVPRHPARSLDDLVLRVGVDHGGVDRLLPRHSDVLVLRSLVQGGSCGGRHDRRCLRSVRGWQGGHHSYD